MSLAESTNKSPSLLQTVWLILQKDLRIEWRQRARINATAFFAILTLLLFSFAAGPQAALLEKQAPGYLWLAIFLASVLALSESMRLENDNEALEGLRLLSTTPVAIFLAKAILNSLMLWSLGLLLLPLSIAFYDAHMELGLHQAALVLFLGTTAISAPGTLYATITSKLQAREVLLPLLLFPVLIPGLLASVKAMTLIYTGDPMQQLPSWLALLFGFNLIYWIVGGLLFGRVIEE